MKIDIVTLFPKMFDGPFSESMIKRAVESNKVKIQFHNLRDWGMGNYKQIDDRPFGGGPGMLLMIEPINKCLEKIKTKESHIIALSAKGTTLKQSISNRLSTKEHIIMLCGHYEGFDHRVLEYLVDEVISIGNYVLTGGELPAMILADSIIRLLPGVLGNGESPESDSYFSDDTTKQFPQYTRPEIFELEGNLLKVPEVLLSGNHAKIDKWRKDNNS